MSDQYQWLGVLYQVLNSWLFSNGNASFFVTYKFAPTHFFRVFPYGPCCSSITFSVSCCFFLFVCLLLCRVLIVDRAVSGLSISNGPSGFSNFHLSKRKVRLYRNIQERGKLHNDHVTWMRINTTLPDLWANITTKLFRNYLCIHFWR